MLASKPKAWVELEEAILGDRLERDPGVCHPGDGAGITRAGLDADP